MSDAIKSFTLHGIVLPLPDAWVQRPGATNYVGPEGVLDPRVEDHGVPINEERLRLAVEELAPMNADVSLIFAQNVNCLYCAYVKKGCLMRTYSFGVALDCEVEVVYLFRPGNDALAASVHEMILNS